MKAYIKYLKYFMYDHAKSMTELSLDEPQHLCYHRFNSKDPIFFQETHIGKTTLNLVRLLRKLNGDVLRNVKYLTAIGMLDGG